MFGLVAVLLQAAVATSTAPSGSWDLLESPLVVTARLLGGEAETKDSMAHYDFAIEVRDSSQTVDLTTSIVAVHDLTDAVGVLRDGISWRKPYLFVRVECGGGNAWACNREVVFRVAGDRATRLGSFAVGDDRKAATSLQGDYFTDIYDKLELANIGLCHACSPLFRVVIADKAGQLTVVKEATWRANEPEYEERRKWLEATLAAEAGGGKLVGNEEIEIEKRMYEAVVANAVLAKYCKRDSELAKLMAAAAPRLTGDRRRWLADALALVSPLELPECWRQND